MDVEVERPAVDVVLADQPRLIGLVDRGLQALALADEFAADVDVAGVRGHGRAGVEAALDQEMRVVPHHLAVLAGAGLGLVGIDHEIMRAVVGLLLGHERPFQPGREAGAAAPALAGRLHLVDEPVAALLDEALGAVPGAARARAVEAPVVLAVEIEEDAVLVLQHSSIASNCRRPVASAPPPRAHWPPRRASWRRHRPAPARARCFRSCVDRARDR